MGVQMKTLQFTPLSLARLSVLAVAVITIQAQAAPFSCLGVVSRLGINGVGEVSMSLAGVTPYHRICTVDTATVVYSLKPNACRMVYTALLSSKVSAKVVQVNYSDGPGCAAITVDSQVTTPISVHMIE
jgi:hypothetical protein